ncbi:translation initiation factor IF-2 subunit beta [Candidatus Bathyarchaeota archaeon]|nr:MAG: translation initiation factor IF-2 subunit beta [Candidatus Bathyarchaeota archaeon]
MRMCRSSGDKGSPLPIGYDEMLKEAYSKIPSDKLKHERFEVPEPQSAIMGSRTFLFNFKEICEALNRDQVHVLRFLSKEMATAGTIDNSRVIFQGRFDQETLKRLIDRYVKDFVICPVCKRPDTRIMKEKRLHFLICDACGARSPVRPV